MYSVHSRHRMISKSNATNNDKPTNKCIHFYGILFATQPWKFEIFIAISFKCTLSYKSKFQLNFHTCVIYTEPWCDLHHGHIQYTLVLLPFAPFAPLFSFKLLLLAFLSHCTKHDVVCFWNKDRKSKKKNAVPHFIGLAFMKIGFNSNWLWIKFKTVSLS